MMAIGAERNARDEPRVAPKTDSSRPLAAFQTRAVPSYPADATSRPSGLKATPWTIPAWPTRVRTTPPSCRSHILIVPSPPAEASTEGLGPKASPASHSGPTALLPVPACTLLEQ
jgi:hypothetical protein